jgi:hypothetical protein
LLRFTVITSLLAIAILALLITGAHSGWFEQPSFSIEILAFFTLSNLTLYWAIGRRLKKQPEDFVGIYLGATVVRILFFGGLIFAVMLLDRPGAARNALFFLVCYFLFTIEEVGALWLKIKS